MLYLFSSFTSILFIDEFINSPIIILKLNNLQKAKKKKKTRSYYSMYRIIFIPMYLFLYTLCFSVTCQFRVYHWAAVGDSYYMLLFNNILDALKEITERTWDFDFYSHWPLYSSHRDAKSGVTITVPLFKSARGGRVCEVQNSQWPKKKKIV